MGMSRFIGHILIVLAVWFALIIYGRITNPQYRQLNAKLAKNKEITVGEESFLYYYTCSMNYLKAAFASVAVLGLLHYLPLILPALGINEVSTTLVTVRKYTQLFAIISAFFGFVAYHRCHYQVENIYAALHSKEPIEQWGE